MNKNKNINMNINTAMFVKKILIDYQIRTMNDIKNILALISSYHFKRHEILKSGFNERVEREITKLPKKYQKEIRFIPFDGTDYNFNKSYELCSCTWYVYNR
ncbi:MAG: hypothetical protein LBV67_00375, partial [Streptococcaceae bacterium]|nr:hypothetical protein [Streptococcaceae bacterium]